MITRHITAGRASRLAVSSMLAFDYQDSGFEDALTSGNLDAADQVPAGACFGIPGAAGRNAIRLQLTEREGAAS